VRARILAIALVLAGCASTELEIPDNHPANASAPTAPIATSRVLRADYDPFAGSAEPKEDQHQHHHHHEKGSGK
jgi:hypothetical protein